jgi:hypothetical protein
MKTTYSFTLRKYGNGTYAEVEFCDYMNGETLEEYLNKGYEIYHQYVNQVGGRVF